MLESFADMTKKNLKFVHSKSGGNAYSLSEMIEIDGSKAEKIVTAKPANRCHPRIPSLAFKWVQSFYGRLAAGTLEAEKGLIKGYFGL